MKNSALVIGSLAILTTTAQSIGQNHAKPTHKQTPRTIYIPQDHITKAGTITTHNATLTSSGETTLDGAVISVSPDGSHFLVQVTPTKLALEDRSGHTTPIPGFPFYSRATWLSNGQLAVATSKQDSSTLKHATEKGIVININVNERYTLSVVGGSGDTKTVHVEGSCEHLTPYDKSLAYLNQGQAHIWNLSSGQDKTVPFKSSIIVIGASDKGFLFADDHRNVTETTSAGKPIGTTHIPEPFSLRDDEPIVELRGHKDSIAYRTSDSVGIVGNGGHVETSSMLLYDFVAGGEAFTASSFDASVMGTYKDTRFTWRLPHSSGGDPVGFIGNHLVVTHLPDVTNLSGSVKTVDIYNGASGEKESSTIIPDGSRVFVTDKEVGVSTWQNAHTEIHWYTLIDTKK